MTHKALEEYFLRIINKPIKERLMFNTAQEYLAILKERMTSLLTQHVAFKDTVEEEYEEGWAFVMRTDSYVDEHGEFIPAKENIIAGDNNGTWSETLDQILDIMGEHYGYNIKEQVYYSVAFPLNVEGQVGYGRMLNDEVFQKLLLSHPEVYDYKGDAE